jgi:hypothetical protein
MKNDQLRVLQDDIDAVRASETGKTSSILNEVFHAEPKTIANVQAELIRENATLMLTTDMYTVPAEFQSLSSEECIAQMDLLLTDTELLVKRIASSYHVSESQIRTAHDLIDKDLVHRIQWAKKLNLEYILAINLMPGTSTDGLNGVKNMTEQDMTEAIERFSIKVKDMLLSELVHLESRDSNSTRTETRDSNSTQTESDRNRTDIEGKLG